jgi:nucleotide-binding universal stress UspA family protein
MFKHILVPTDGSAPSRNAAQAAVELARLSGGRITALYVAPDYKLGRVAEQSGATEFVPLDAYTREVENDARPALEQVMGVARAAGIESDAHWVLDDNTAHAIVRAAEKHGCDTIVVGSHGHKGIKRMLLGSVAQKVLVDAKIPVLVTR